MAFDPSLLTLDEESSGFDPSLLTPEPTAEEILSRPAIPAWEGAGEDTLRAPSTGERFRSSAIGHALLGPTPAERIAMEARGPESRLGPPGQEFGIIPMGEKMLGMTSVPPQLAQPIRRATDPFVELLPPIPRGIVEGGRELGLTMPIAPFGPLAKVALPIFTAELASQFPEQKKAYDQAIRDGRYEEAAKIATMTMGGATLLGVGAGHELRSKPGVIERTPDASKVSEATTVHGDVRSQPVEGAREVPIEEGGQGVQPQTEGGLPENAPPEVQRNVELTPTIKAGDVMVTGKSHAEALDAATKSGDATKIMAAMTGERGFTDQNGKFYTRKEALEVFKEQGGDLSKLMNPEQGLNSEDLRDAGMLKHLEAPKGEVSRPDWRVTVQPDEVPGSGYVQIDEVKNGQNTWSKSKETLAKEGITVPDFKSLPRGQYSFDEAVKLLKEQKQAKEAAKDKASTAAISKLKQLKKQLESRIDEIESVKKITPEQAAALGTPELAGQVGFEAAKQARDLLTDVNTRLAQESTSPEREVAPGVLIDPFLYRTAIKPAAKLAIQGAKAAYSNKHVQAQIGALNRKRQAFSTLFRSFENRNIMDQTMDAADNKAFTAGQQVRKGLEIGHDKADQNAASAIIAAGFDQAKLPDLLRKAQAGKNAEAIKAVQDAMAQWSRLEPLAKRGQADFDGQIQEENWHGINTEYHADYLPGIYDQDLWMGNKRPFVVGGGGSGVSTSFKKGKTFDTPFDAIEAGYTPKSIALSELAEHRVRSGQRLINRKRWADGLRTEFDPTDHKPIVADVIRKPRGPGQPWFEVAPPGYRVQEIIPGHRIAVHEVYTPLFKALTGESAISSTEIGKLALETEGAMKHGLLAFDTYHMSRIAQKSLILTGKLPTKRGRSLLEYADKDLTRAVTEGLITPEIEQWVRANRPVAQLGLDSGLNVGRVQEALYTSFVREFPGLKQTVGKFNKWVFEDVTRSALMEGFIHEFNRVSRIKPTEKPEVIARQVARDLNTYFGNLGRQGVFKSKTAQDMARLVALAPQWFESMGRTEAKGFLQLAKGVTYDPVVHKSVAVGSLGKAMGTGLLAYFAGMQVLNLITRRQPTWKNEEEGHKLDAWIPSADGKGNGFWLSPFAIPAEITHDMIRYTKKDGSALKAAAHILTNKASPPARAFAALATGKSYWGDPKADNSWDRVKKAAWALNPTPIPVQPLERKSYPGQLQRQVTASLGVKTEPADSPVQQMFSKAKSFMEKQGKKPMEFEMTDDPSYFKLRAALRADNNVEAQKVMDGLLKNHTRQQVFNAMERNVNHPFTGSVAQEGKFKRTLTSRERQIYQQAVNDRRDEFRKFKQLRSTGALAPASGFDPSLLVPE